MMKCYRLNLLYRSSCPCSRGPLPHYIVAALTAAFNLEDEGAKELDEALAAIAGEAIEDLQVEAANIQVHAQAAAA